MGPDVAKLALSNEAVSSENDVPAANDHGAENKSAIIADDNAKTHIDTTSAMKKPVSEYMVRIITLNCESM